MTGNLSLLHNLESILPCSIGFADGGKTVSVRKGTLTLSSTLTLPNVLFVQDLNCTLISVSKLLKQTGGVAMFTDTLCVLQDRFSRTLIGAGEERDGVNYFKDVMAARIHRAVADSDSSLWHQRLGHPSFSVLSSLPLFSGVSKSACSGPCDVCFRAKQTREVFSESFNKTKECFSLIHCDVWGPYRVPSSTSAVYFLTIVDDYSRAVWTFLLLEKSENLCVSLPTFANKVLYTKRRALQHLSRMVRVERKNRHILNVAPALLFQGNLPIKFWGEAVLTAAYLINRTPSAIHLGCSPYEMLHGHKSSYDQLRVFGSECYTHRASRDKDKFGQRSCRCVFLGYLFGKKGWKVFDIEREEFIVSRDVVFKESVFPYSVVSPSLPQFSPSDCLDDDWIISPVPFVVRGSDSTLGENREPNALPVIVPTQEPESVNPQEPETEKPQEPLSVTVTDLEQGSRDMQGSVSSQPVVSNASLGRGLHQRSASVKLRDYVTYNVVCSQDPHHAPPDPSSHSSTVQGTSLYSLSHYISDDRFSPGQRAFFAAITAGDEPKHFKDAVAIKVWNDAMGIEVDALEQKRTWDIYDLPPGKEALGCLWVYKTKYKSDGTVERYKVRILMRPLRRL
ncbi:unnamed protein product [Microthlaspi erraticum]|uniref:Uncharacterized protein n=1 Tax=Microthlaspi erraticum TaxID=1685480 RepID=A0A6D2IER9_9BRAS|nr:unnamed protein product [Microthlaspi erraticum]